MASEKQIRANRENARKSTGPKTAEGKARSRLNAYKHGMAAGDTSQALPPEDLALFQERLGKWTVSAQAKGDLEHYLVASAAVASIRMDRCARHEFARIARKRRDAVARWTGKQRKRAEVLGGQLLEALADEADRQDEAEALLAALGAVSAGCDWILQRLEELADALDEQGGWDAQQVALAACLLTVGPEPVNVEPMARACREGDAAGAEAARERLTEALLVVAVQLAKTREEHWHVREAPALSEVIDLAAQETGPDAALQLRYASASTLMFQRALNQLRANQKERRRIDAERAEKGLPPLDPDEAAASGHPGPQAHRQTPPAGQPTPPTVPTPGEPVAEAAPPARNEANSVCSSGEAESTSVEPPAAPGAIPGGSPTGWPDFDPSAGPFGAAGGPPQPASPG